MNISHIKIKSILGIDELEFSPENKTIITGRNGVGKTSILEAIKAVFQGGQDATLVRKGAAQGEVVLVLDDGTEIRKRVNAEGATKVDVKQNGKVVSSPATLLKRLTDSISVNPVDFLHAEPKARTRILLEAMPLKLDTEHLSKIAGIPVQATPGTNALALIDMIRKTVFDERTMTNRAVDEKDKTINQLQNTLPELPEEAGSGDEAEMQARLDSATAERVTEIQRIDGKLQTYTEAYSNTVTNIRAEAQAKIDAIRKEMEAKVKAETDKLDEIKRQAQVSKDRATNEFTEAATPLQQALAIIRSNRENAAKRAQGLDTIKKMQTDLEELVKIVHNQRKALADIDAYRESLLKDCPIPGLTLQNGEIFVDGIALDRLNTARQVQIAMAIAALRAGELRICCVDRAESLDSDQLEALQQAAADNNLQLFMTQVDDGDYSITTE